MSPLAILMMCLAIAVVWGGLAVSTVHLLRNADETSGDLGAETPDAVTGHR